MNHLTTAQLLFVLENSRQGQFEWLWNLFSAGGSGSNPPLSLGALTFDTRRELFFEAVESLIRLGYVRLTDMGEQERPPIGGTVDQQLIALRNNFPAFEDDLELEDGQSWFDTDDCLFDISWTWPGRKPAPLFPGHQEKYTYTDQDWDGRIHPEWSTWRFTPGRLSLDDFDSEEQAIAFFDAHPDYYENTPRIERMK